MLLQEIVPGVAWLRTNIANVYFVGTRPHWVLVDAGTQGYAGKIRQAAEERFGAGARPAAMFLTHGHFDHAGSVRELSGHWDVPVYAHALERPFLTGRSEYPPQDPTIGGCMGFVSRFFPTRTANLGDRLRELPPGGVVPGLENWTWYHTPGHTAGHVSFFHEGQSVLISGDAVITVDTDSCRALLRQEQRISRPPAYFTYDWGLARQSVELLARLRPAAICAGHGVPMSGAGVAGELRELADYFPAPRRGRYAHVPARTDESGILYVPPPAADRLPAIAAGVGAAAFLGSALVVSRRRSRKNDRALAA
jgi:glyoxylase-like metal-dependent hydrolase (beta-lactamase superfamily II)